MFVCISLAISNIVCWVECPFQKPCFEEVQVERKRKQNPLTLALSSGKISAWPHISLCMHIFGDTCTLNNKAPYMDA